MWIKSPTALPIALAALLLLAGGEAQAQYYPQPYFSPDGGGADATAALIDGATETIDVAMYSISTSGPIWQALERATARGVKVRVILEGARSSANSKVKALEGIGAHVFGVTNTLHEKFALVDAGIWYRRKLVNGSANWSTGAETRYSENTVVWGSHYHLFHAFQQEFNRLLAASRAVSQGAAAHMQPVSLNDVSTSVRRYERAVFTSQNSGGSTVVADEIIALMRQAESSILIDVAHFNSQSIARALIDIRRAKPDLEIEVMLDLGEYADSKSRCKDLERAGIDVRYKAYSLSWSHPRSQLQHHKTLIVDRRDVISGSYNWSDTAEHDNYENVIVVQGHVRRNRDLVKAFVDEHEKLWSQGRDLYAPFMEAMTAAPGDPAYRRVVPMHFDTDYFRGSMALDRDELSALRSAAWAAGAFGRQPNGRPNSAYSYLDREARDVWHGAAPSGRFAAPAGTTGLVGAVSAQ